MIYQPADAIFIENKSGQKELLESLKDKHQTVNRPALSWL